jgi:hypothetical protein
MFAPRRGVLVTAVAACSVAVAAILALVLADSEAVRRHDVSRYYGALTGVTPSSAQGETVALAGLLGTVTIVPGTGSLVCRLQTVAVVEGGVTLRIIGAGVAVETVEGDSADLARSSAAPGVVDIVVPGSGVTTVTVSLPRERGSVVVQVSARGHTVAERSVRTKESDDR